MPQRRIFVFGSNIAGRHGAGAARYAALNYKARHGVGEGLTGDAYALPTKDENIKTLPIEQVYEAIKRFKIFALNNPEMDFLFTAVGCGLAGFTREQIGGLCCGFPDNVYIQAGLAYATDC